MNYDEPADFVTGLFNGPPLAGVGATTDPGIPARKYHIVPYQTAARAIGTYDGSLLVPDPTATGARVPARTALKYAIHNVDTVFNWNDFASRHPNVSPDRLDNLRRDAIAIINMSILGNYYLDECRGATNGDVTRIQDIPAANDLVESYLNVNMVNRAVTWIMARCHTKWQTNHVTGGPVFSASMAATFRAFTGVSAGVSQNPETRSFISAAVELYHWALHPINEKMIMPLVISGTNITSYAYHANGPPPTSIAMDEFFRIRTYTPPASCHHYYVAQAAVKYLEPLGIVKYLPNASRLHNIQRGFRFIQAHGAAAHPAANYWGLTKVTSDQKSIEDLCQDLGYAVLKLMPTSSLAASPILRKTDQLNQAWRGFIDQIATWMAEADASRMDQDVASSLKAALALAGSDNSSDLAMSVSRLRLEPVLRAEERHEEEHEEHEGGEGEEHEEGEGEEHGGGEGEEHDLMS